MHPALRALLKETVTVRPKTGRSGYGAPAYGAPVTYPARCRQVSRLVRAPDGQEKLASWEVRLDGDAVVGPEDEVTLPNGTKPPILRVSSVPDETGVTYTVKVWLQ